MLPATDDGLAVAGELLRSGRLVAFPTETVYGLGADALDPEAVAAIFTAKQRPADNPLIVHLPSAERLGEVAARVTPLAEQLAAAFWPGPLTLVLDADSGVPQATTGGLGTVAVRVPDHPVALALLEAAAVPIAAPSANRSGRPSPTTAAHVQTDLGGSIDAIVDGGACPVGVESTVVDARGEVPIVLREGAITREELGSPPTVTDGDLAASPGTRHRHYQPTCRVVLADPGTAAAHAAALAGTRERVGLVAREAAPDGVLQVGRFADAGELAVLLYAALRDAEDADVDVLVVEAVAEQGVGRAIMDRLRRAAG